MNEKLQLLILKGAISELPEAEQGLVKDAEARIREVVTSFGDIGTVALALVAAEVLAEP